MCPTPSQAQLIELAVRAGVNLSSPLVTDHIATAPARQLLQGAVDTLVRVVPGPGVSAGVTVRAAFSPRAALEATVDWTHTQLQAEEDGGERDMQGLDVLQWTLGAAWAVRSDVQIGGAVGLLRYITAKRGIFAGGSDVLPLAEVRIAYVPPVLSRRLALVLGMQVHRFGTQTIRSRGGTDGNVTRLDAGIRVRLAELGR